MFIDTLILANMMVYMTYNKLRSWRTVSLCIGVLYIGYHFLKQLVMHFASSQLRDAFSHLVGFLRETVTGANWASIGWWLEGIYWPFFLLLLLLVLAVAYPLKLHFNRDEMMVICIVLMVCYTVESFWLYPLLCIALGVFGYVLDLTDFGKFVMSNRIIFGGQVVIWFFAETTTGAFWLNTSLVSARAATELLWPFIAAVVIIGPFYYLSSFASRLERSTFFFGVCSLSLIFMVVVISWGFFHAILAPAVDFGWTWLQQKLCLDCAVNCINLAPGACGQKSNFLARPPQPEPGWKINYAPGYDGTPFYRNNRA